MTTPDLFLGRERLHLVKRIGRGGEGEVYLIAGAPKKAIKYYTGRLDRGREAKVRAMVGLGLARASSLVAFPEAIVSGKSGEFAGFTMRLVEGYRPIHELYGVKSRKIHYTSADYRFLIRAAANTARAIGQVHASPCVIGDLNHSGILVASDATVALIDADSFQFQANGRLYPCLVGVPDFTPPELHGRSLNGVVRTKIHDRFGLAVAIFQLLFMGRHPYAGRGGGDLTLDQLIARNLFAYSRSRANGVAPPAAMATLDDLPADVADAFERAFGSDPSRRPSAEQWISLLKGLEGRLSRCASHPMHFYPTAAKACPWCRMEASSGAILFIASITGPAAVNLSIGGGDFDVEKVWAAIRAIAIPDPQTLMAKLPPLPSEPSEEAKQAAARDAAARKEAAAREAEAREAAARKAEADKLWIKSRKRINQVLDLVLAVVIVVLWIKFPADTALWLCGLVFAVWWARTPSLPWRPNPTPAAVVHPAGTLIYAPSWQVRYAEAEALWDDALERWRERLGIEPLHRLRGDLEQVIDKYRYLAALKAQAVARLKAERRNRQLNNFLDRFLIKNASISGIGPAKTVTLASFGIESAADVTRSAIESIPGFGPATADKLIAWRAVHERRFIYNPAPTPQDLQEQAKVEAEYGARAGTIARQIAGGQAEMAHLLNTFRQRLAAENRELGEIAVRRAQLEADLAYLGVSKPLKGRSPAPAGRQTPACRSSPGLASPPSPPYQAPPPTRPTSSVTCPQCGAVMIRLTARRGHRHGHSFWGCSRFPQCRATRN